MFNLIRLTKMFWLKCIDWLKYSIRCLFLSLPFFCYSCSTSVSSNSFCFLECAISFLAFAFVWVTGSFASMLLFDKSLTLCFDKLVIKDLLSLILLLWWLSDFSGSTFLVLKGDLLPEKLDLTCNATKLSLNIF